MTKFTENIKTKAKLAWNSPTIMTWMSYSTKSASLLLVTPLLLTKFTEAEMVIWYLFATIISMNGLADLGFRNTFVRFIAYANGGATHIGKQDSSQKTDGQTNWDLIGKLYSHMLKLYLPLSIVILIAFLIGGYYSLRSTLALVDDTFYYWLSWILLSITTSLDFYGKIYYNYLEGLNEIALVRRVESFFKILVILAFFIVLTFCPSIFNMSVVLNAANILNFARNYTLANRIKGGKLKTLKRYKVEIPFLLEIWKPAWRSGVSGLLAIGLTNVVSILFVQVSTTSASASYLFAMRVLTEIRNIANAPFYSKIPRFARLQAEGNREGLIKLAKNGMQKSHIMFVAAVITAGLSIEPFLNFIGSKIDFVDPLMWVLLSFAFYVHRYSAMHIQLYMTSNHIISHITDSISGALFIISAYIVNPYIGLYAIPVGMIIGYLGFYSWFSASRSLKLLGLGFFKFERYTSLPFATILILYYIFALLY